MSVCSLTHAYICTYTRTHRAETRDTQDDFGVVYGSDLARTHFIGHAGVQSVDFQILRVTLRDSPGADHPQ